MQYTRKVKAVVRGHANKGINPSDQVKQKPNTLDVLATGERNAVVGHDDGK